MAATKNLSYWDFVRAAFWRRVPVLGLGAMPLNQMIVATFGVLGIANPGFWLLGGAVEVAYLTFRSSSERFQRLIRGQALLAQQMSWEEKLTHALNRLTPPNRSRYQALLNQCRRVVGLQEVIDPDNLADLKDLQASGLNQLLAIFLRLLTSRELTLESLRNVQPGVLEAEIQRVELRLAKAEPDADQALMRSLQGTLEIQKKRLENLRRAHASLEIIDAELDRIEQQVELIREESAVRGRPEVLSTRLDAVASAMSETHRWIDENESVLGGLASDFDTTSPGLPQIPE